MKNSFIFAFRGFYACIRTERNLRFHLAVSFYVILGGFITRLSEPEWLAVLLCIGAVLMLAASSAVVGGFIFFRAEQLERVLTFIREQPALAVAVVLTLPVTLYLIFRSYNHDKNSRHHHRRTSERR